MIIQGSPCEASGTGLVVKNRFYRNFSVVTSPLRPLAVAREQTILIKVCDRSRGRNENNHEIHEMTRNSR